MTVLDEDQFSFPGSVISRFGILPVVLFGTGFLLFVIGIVLAVKPSFTKPSIRITDEATGSAAVGGIRVDIEGAVMQPGVYNLPIGARIHDGLIAAGGLSQNADRAYIAKMLNQAARLSDGGKIYIPFNGESSNIVSTVKGSHDNSTGNSLLGETISVLNINTASESDLDRLPGIGPVTAGKIIAGRPYNRSEELRDRKIVNSSTWEKIKDKITVY